MDYIALITYIFVITITPGPNNILVVASGGKFGYRKTLPHIIGIGFGTALLTAFVCLGLGAVFIKLPILHQILSWAGLIYMLYLAWKLLGMKVSNEKSGQSPFNLWQAILFQFINPKVWVSMSILASIFMPKGEEVITPTIIISLIVGLISFPCTSAWALFGKAIRKFLNTQRNQLIFNYVMAILLVVTALLIVIK